MSAPELIDPCSQFALLTDKQAVGEVLSQEEGRWIADHARMCFACGTEMAIYSSMPRLLGVTRISSTRGSHHPRTYRAPSRHAESRKRGSQHDTPVQRPANDHDHARAPHHLACTAAAAAALSVPTGVAARGGATISATCGPADARLAPVALKRPPELEPPVVKRSRGSIRTLKVWILAAAVITVGGVATAQFVGSRPPKAPLSAPSADAAPGSDLLRAGGASRKGTDNGMPVAPPTAPTEVAPSAPATTAPPSSGGGRHLGFTTSASQLKAAAAAEAADAQAAIEDLLREARGLRSKARPSEAASTYQRLIREYPRSPEARAARVSVGDLQLAHLGDPAGALASFDAYLQGGAGALTLEARHGRIRALSALGRTTEEQREIARFVKDYPASPQAAVLSAKLPASAR